MGILHSLVPNVLQTLADKINWLIDEISYY